LLLAALATFDHRTIRLKVPIFVLTIPLSDESEKEFNTRVNNLPVQLLPDSPKNRFGDRDKLQHFFGSAFITYVFNTADGAERIGYAIEQGEHAAIVGGDRDVRDIHADMMGQQFGLALMNNPYRYPSEFLAQSFPLSDSSMFNENMELKNGFNTSR